ALLGDDRLGIEAHGGIGVIPIALDAEALELLALHVEPMLGVGAALRAEADHRGGVREVGLSLALGAVILLLDLPLDGKAMTVPARHVARILAHHRLASVDY